MIDPSGEGEAPAEPVFWAARREARPPDRDVAPEAAEGMNPSHAPASVPGWVGWLGLQSQEV